MATLGERARSLRHEAHLTLAYVANEAGLSTSYIAEIEKDRRIPTLDSLARIAAVFGLDVIGMLRGVSPFDASGSDADRSGDGTT